MGIKVQAHRGASAYAPENTLPAFKLAVEMKADGVENDIRLTKDGVFVVSHDGNVDRMSDGSGNVHELTFEELRQFDFGIKSGEQFKGTKIATLDEFLEVVKVMEVINIEFKPMHPDNGDKQEAFEKLYASLQKADCVERTIISSFDHALLLALKKTYPNLKTGLLYGHQLTPEETIEMVKYFQADAIHPALSVLNEEIAEACRQNGTDINVWTVDAPEAIERAIGLGVTGIITDVPDRVLRALGR